MKQYSTYNYDPLEGAEVMTLMGLDPARLSIPRIAAQVREVVTFFAGKTDRRSQILKQMMKSGDKLDNLWTYVQLQKEKASKLETLNPEDFEPDVAAQIVSGHLTLDKKSRIREDIKNRKEAAKNKELNRQEKRQDTIQQKKVEEALPDNKLDFYSGILDELDSIDSQLGII